MSTQLSVTEKYCDKIIRMFQTYGLKALLKRDFGLRQKKEQKKLNNYEISLLHSLVRHSPPKNYKKWTYNYLTEIINQSALFENEIGLCTLRSIMISKGIDLNAAMVPKKQPDIFCFYDGLFSWFQHHCPRQKHTPKPARSSISGSRRNYNESQLRSPSVKGRKVWGELVPYGQVWRAGANEATTFEIDKDVTIEGTTLPAGKYGFFVIPSEGKWTLIFNKVAAQWGAFKYDE